MMDILMSETCWAHKKWNKITSDISLVFYSSVFPDLEDSLDLSIYLLIFPCYCVRSDDTGKPIVRDELLPILSHVSFIALDFWMPSSARWVLVIWGEHSPISIFEARITQKWSYESFFQYILFKIQTSGSLKTNVKFPLLKVKAKISIQAWTGPECSKRLRLLDF